MSKTASTKLGAEIQDDGPTGQVNDPSYKTSRNEAIPVVDDEAQVEDPGGRENADSNKQLEKDDREAIDTENIIKDKRKIGKSGRTLGRYAEPTDEDFGLME